MSKKRNGLEFGINPLLDFTMKEFGFDESFSLFGPYAGASIRPRKIDRHTIEVSMPLVISNTNYVGTHFGGSLYSMCDPFFMFILMECLGDDYIVWDKSARIEFIKPGVDTVTARFHIDEDEIEAVKKIVAEKKKTTRIYTAEVTGEAGETVARIEKELYIRRKPSSRA